MKTCLITLQPCHVCFLNHKMTIKLIFEMSVLDKWLLLSTGNQKKCEALPGRSSQLLRSESGASRSATQGPHTLFLVQSYSYIRVMLVYPSHPVLLLFEQLAFFHGHGWDIITDWYHYSHDFCNSLHCFEKTC